MTLHQLSDAELVQAQQEIAAYTGPLYAQLEALGDDAFEVRSSKYVPAAQALADDIQPWHERAVLIGYEQKRRAQQLAAEALWSRKAEAVSRAPVYQRRNGWEIVRLDTRYVVRDPVSKEEVYTGCLRRCREVADESTPVQP
jgi:hypothetical protein